jgi:outer membrane protein OmpA-like peptidoglycan-associated protein
MENNKPVFESFDQFVQFVYDAALNEGLKVGDLTELKTALAAEGLDANGRKALGAIEEVINQGRGAQVINLNRMSACLSRMTQTDVTEISSIDFDLQQFEYKNLLGGSVLDGAGKRIGFAQYLAKLNLANLLGSKEPYYDAKKKKFISNEKNNGDVLQGSGPVNQYIIVDNQAKLDAKVWRYDNPVKNQLLDTPQGFIGTPETVGKSGADSITTQYYFYYPVKIVPQGGVEYQSREVIQFVRPKTTTAETLKPIVIQDDNTLFDVNKSDLKEEGKAAILAALGNVASANSITVTGGASQEGDKARNEALCKERAKAVADYIKSTTSFAGSDVKVSDKLDIQPKESTADRKTWRKVTLNVEGEYLAPVDKTTTELVYMASEDSNKADKIIIAQAVIQLNSSVIA